MASHWAVDWLLVPHLESDWGGRLDSHSVQNLGFQMDSQMDWMKDHCLGRSWDFHLEQSWVMSLVMRRGHCWATHWGCCWVLH